MATCKHCGGDLIPKDINGKEVLYCSVCNKAFVVKTADSSKQINDKSWPKYCSKCAMPLRPMAKFCPACGNKITNEFSQFKFCDECGSKIDINAIYCSMCGTSLEDDEVSQDTYSEENVVAAQNISLNNNLETDYRNIQNVQDNKEPKIKTIICPQCGSTDIEMFTEEHGRCKHCNSSIYMGQNKTINNNINININNKGNNVTNDYPGVYKIESTKSDKEFKEIALTKLAIDEKTPIDIFDYDFDEQIIKEEAIYIYYKAKIQVSYSCLVGVDYKVTYSDGNGNRRTKTETKWAPQSGNHLGEYSIAVPIDDLENADAKSINAATSSIESSTLVPYHIDRNIELKNQNLAEELLKADAERDCKSKITGHRISDFNCSHSIDMLDVKVCVIPRYTMEFKKKDEEEKYYVSSFVSGEINAFGKFPQDDNNINALATIKNMPMVISSIVLLTIVTILTIVLSAVTTVNAFLYVVLSIVAIVFAIVSICTRKVFKKKIISKNIEIKKKKLMDYLSSHNMG